MLGAMAGEVEHLRHHALETACRMVETAAREAIGTYRYGWPQLAQSTQTERVRLGFTPNDPLLRTGDLRDSVSHQVLGNIGYIGSNDMKAVWNFLGTSSIPPRDPILGAIMTEEPNIESAIGHSFVAWLGGRGLPATRIR